MSSAVESILKALPVDHIGKQVGLEGPQASSAVSDAIEALLSGMTANASDDDGAASLVKALPQHSGDLLAGGVNLNDIDVEDGRKIVKNVFGDKTDSVVSALDRREAANVSGGDSLFSKLLPVLAPVVMAYLSKQLLQPTGTSTQAPQSTSGGGIDDLLGGILGGGAAPSQQGGSAGGLGEILGGLLGGGGQTSSSGGGGLGGILGGLLGGGSAQSSSGGGLSDILGGLLGGGKR